MWQLLPPPTQSCLRARPDRQKREFCPSISTSRIVANDAPPLLNPRGKCLAPPRNVPHVIVFVGNWASQCAELCYTIVYNSLLRVSLRCESRLVVVSAGSSMHRRIGRTLAELVRVTTSPISDHFPGLRLQLRNRHGRDVDDDRSEKRLPQNRRLILMLD